MQKVTKQAPWADWLTKLAISGNFLMAAASDTLRYQNLDRPASIPPARAVSDDSDTVLAGGAANRVLS